MNSLPESDEENSDCSRPGSWRQRDGGGQIIEQSHKGAASQMYEELLVEPSHYSFGHQSRSSSVIESDDMKEASLINDYYLKDRFLHGGHVPNEEEVNINSIQVSIPDEEVDVEAKQGLGSGNPALVIHEIVQNTDESKMPFETMADARITEFIDRIDLHHGIRQAAIFCRQLQPLHDQDNLYMNRTLPLVNLEFSERQPMQAAIDDNKNIIAVAKRINGFLLNPRKEKIETAVQVQ